MDAPVTDPFDLQRFVSIQNHNGTFDSAIEELRHGRKATHWMWFVFPQIAGLGLSEMARKFAISSLPEARAYLEHPLLGPRLVRCAQIVAAIDGRSAEQIFGGIDEQKLHSSMTLFRHADPDETVFDRVLHKYFAGRMDPGTETILGVR